MPSCLSSSTPRYYPRANRTQGSWRASERLLRGWGRRDWSRIKSSLAISCLSSHLISEDGDCGGGGVRGNCRTSMFARPFSDAAVAMSVMAADDGRASDRWRIGHRRRRRTGCGPDGRWMADGQTQREKNFRFMTCYRWNRYRVLWGWLLQQPEGRTKTMRCHLEPLLLENK